jgi:hypothetical protein
LIPGVRIDINLFDERVELLEWIFWPLGTDELLKLTNVFLLGLLKVQVTTSSTSEDFVLGIDIVNLVLILKGFVLQPSHCRFFLFLEL